VHPVLALFIRNIWANRELLATCASLDPELLQRPRAGTFGPIAPTLGHIVRGEQNYLERLTGDDPSEWVMPDRPPGLDRLTTLAGDGGERMLAVLAGGPDPDRLVWGEWQGRRVGVTDWVLLVEHVQHGDDHRAQVGTILGTAGVEPVDVSGRAFAATGPAPPAGVTAGAWADALLSRFLDHSGWATHALLEHCLELGDQALGAGTEGTYGTLRETLTHLVDVDASYLSWLTGGEDVLLDDAATPDVLRRHAERTREGWAAYLAGGPDHERVVEAGTSRRPVPSWVLVTQAVHHANEHRAHACTILGTHGLALPALDGWAYGAHAGGLPDAGPIEGTGVQ
jgi:uncharacterized damage-inducible protein DinB